LFIINHSDKIFTKIVLIIKNQKMITHYLKIAFRNMLKYKNQTLISVIGLAVGFS